MRDQFRASLQAEVDTDDNQQMQQAFAAFLSKRTADEIARCPYRSEAVEQAYALALEANRSGIGIGELTAGESDEVRGLAWSYFAHPIRLDRAAGVLSNGQHRACGLKLSRATTCLAYEV